MEQGDCIYQYSRIKKILTAFAERNNVTNIDFEENNYLDDDQNYKILLLVASFLEKFEKEKISK
ncbi:hypothetical protein [Salipaludibacillus aurantiacus]|uniref:Uncharacterized protein n=1 Tax=Salipaludibacillus aurantiacus TaxID=1601833 RepID=A0A1H9UFM8_9BACI|nr:hypothetical protein [Salipaludibacillus aurantiacus]SES08360.1 hypothetical protein SAMN05518684_107192 [Salipaludibacillus aurantiacus]